MSITNKKIASSFGWTAIIIYTNRVLGILTTLILAKMIAPEEFGIVAVASMMITVLGLLKDLGFSEAIIYQKRDDQAAIDSAYTLLIGGNVVLFLAAAALAPVVARFYDAPILLPVIVALASNLVWDAARAVPRALTRKNLEFRRLIVPEVVPVTISSALSIWMALSGYGVWSLVAKTVVHSVLGMILLRNLPDRRPRFRFDPTAARELMQYGRFIVGTTVVLVALYNIDRFYVSRIAGIAALGQFELAMRLVELPVKELSFVIGSVMFPVFARLDRGDGSQGRAIFKTLKYTAFVSVPTAVAIAVYGPALVMSIYGDRWAGMIAPMQVLAGYGMLRSLSSIIHDGFKASGRPDLMLRSVACKLIAIGSLGIPVLQNFGLVGICVLIVVTYFVAILWEIAALAKLVGADLAHSFWWLAPPVILPVVVIPGTYALAGLVLGTVAIWQLTVLVPLTGIVYLTSVWCFDRQTVRDVQLLARSVSST
jgi:O-antigen/teichoic acid export membrane protein